MRKRLRAALAVLASMILLSPVVRAQEERQNCLKDTMFVFDASGSMATTDFTAKKPHIERVKEALRTVVPEIPAERRLGLIVYGQGAYNRCDCIELKHRPQRNAGPAILAEVEKIVPAGRTPLTQSVRDAAEVLQYREKSAVVVLITDGEETCGGKTCDLSRELKKSGKDITVHVIGYRNKEAGGLSDLSSARCLAEDTGGLYLRVETVEQLIDALRKTMTCPLFSDGREQSAAKTKYAAAPARSLAPSQILRRIRTP